MRGTQAIYSSCPKCDMGSSSSRDCPGIPAALAARYGITQRCLAEQVSFRMGPLAGRPQGLEICF